MKRLQLMACSLFLAASMNVQAQTPATELVKFPILELERGQSIDLYDQYTVVGSKFGYNSTNGSAMLYNNNQFVRSYRTSPISTSDGLGGPKTVAIGQHAIVMGAPLAQKVGIAKKTWDGSHYSSQISQYLYQGSSETGTRFGEAVAISGSWIAVGASKKGVDGGVKMFRRNDGTGVWEDKGWLPLPNFSASPFRTNQYGWVQDAWFGNDVEIKNSNLIVAAPGISSFYIYRFDGNNWVFSSASQGSSQVGQNVTISDEYAASSSSNYIKVYKKHWDNTWYEFQTLTLGNNAASDLAIEGSRLVAGMLSVNAGEGEVRYFELKSHQVGNNWVYNFAHVGKMYVNKNASPYGLDDIKLLGYSVAIHNSTVVSGAPNLYYEGYADGGAFKANFYQMLPASNGNRMGESSEEAFAELSLFPNPATNVINCNSEILSASAINVLGVELQLSANGKKIDVSSLPAGIYQVTVITEAGIATKSISVQ